MVYSHISYNSPTGAYSYYETRRTPFRAPPGSGDIQVTTRSSEITPSGEAKRHRTFNYHSTDSSTGGPYDHKIETWIEPRSARSSSCSRALGMRSLSRNKEEHAMSRAEHLLQKHTENDPLWNRTSIRRSVSRNREEKPTSRAQRVLQEQAERYPLYNRDSRRSMSRGREENSSTRAERLLQEHMESTPLWNRNLRMRSLSRSREVRPITRAECVMQERTENDPLWIKSQVASIKNDIGHLLEKADQKHEDHREKDYRSTWVKDEMSSLRNDIRGLENYVSSPRSDVKRLEDRLDLKKVQYDYEVDPRYGECGSRGRSVSRFPLLL